MGTHPIFESDFDCLTELKRVGRFCQIMDLDWFVDEVVSIATRLHGLDPVTDRALNAPFGDEDYENALVNQIQDIDLEHQPESAACNSKPHNSCSKAVLQESCGGQVHCLEFYTFGPRFGPTSVFSLYRRLQCATCICLNRVKIVENLTTVALFK